VNRERLHSILLRHEGLRLRPYTDTAGKLTIGIGRNLTDFGIREKEAYYLCDNDIDAAVAGLSQTVKAFSSMDDVRQEVLINMAFNMGLTKLMSANPKMIAAVEAKNFLDAAKEMLDGPWKDQVHGRAIELSTAMARGDYA